MRKLIINADDLGMSDYVNSQIERCIELGVITSSTLMPNAPAFDGGVRIAKLFPQISVGVHLNIIEFAPLTNKDVFKKYGMLDEDGNFIDGAAFVVSYNEELKQAVFEEWDAQITKVKNSGLIPTHCDSHQHTHAILALQEVLCKVMDKHNITKVRRKIIPSIQLMLRAKKNPVVVKLDKSNALQAKRRNILYRRMHLLIVKYQSWLWNRRMSSKYITTDAFYSFRDFYFNKDILHKGSESSNIELMCHPGNIPFQEETNILMKDMSWLCADYKLSTYNEV